MQQLGTNMLMRWQYEANASECQYKLYDKSFNSNVHFYLLILISV